MDTLALVVVTLGAMLGPLSIVLVVAVAAALCILVGVPTKAWILRRRKRPSRWWSPLVAVPCELLLITSLVVTVLLPHPLNIFSTVLLAAMTVGINLQPVVVGERQDEPANDRRTTALLLAAVPAALTGTVCAFVALCLSWSMG